MLIECPACHTRAQIPESQEGAKVRCGSCGRVYPARDKLQPSAMHSGSPAVRMAIVGGVVALAGLGLVIALRGDPPPVVAKDPEPVAPPPAEPDVLAWNGPLMTAAVALHEAAHAGARDKLRELLHGPRLYSAALLAAAQSGVPFDGAAATFDGLGPADRQAWLDRQVDELVSGSAADLVPGWRPYDGVVVGDVDDTETVVHLSVTPRDGASTEKRTVEWRFARERGAWKAFAWRRHLTQDELRAARKESRGYQQVTLTDGSVVFEREPERLEHLADTPPELRARIDERFAVMIDLDQTFGARDALDEIVAIGRPAIPILLTALFEIPLDTDEQRIQVNLVVKALNEITGQDFGFRPEIGEGSAFGTTLERRTSALRQWFAWWHRDGDEFVARPAPEPVTEEEEAP